MTTTPDLLPQGATPELITEIPASVLGDMGARAAKLTQFEIPAAIDTVPGGDASSYRSPEQAVAGIQAQLAERPVDAGIPEIRAGGTDGIITQRGEN